MHAQISSKGDLSTGNNMLLTDLLWWLPIQMNANQNLLSVANGKIYNTNLLLDGFF